MRTLQYLIFFFFNFFAPQNITNLPSKVAHNPTRPRVFTPASFCFVQLRQFYGIWIGAKNLFLNLSHGVHSRLSSRTVPSRDGTGQDLKTLKVPWSCGPGTKEVQKSQDFFRRSRDVLGSPRTRGPRSRDKTGQDLETLKVPWSCGPRTKEVRKSQDFF